MMTKAKDLTAGLMYDAADAIEYLCQLWRETDGAEGISPEDATECRMSAQSQMFGVETVKIEPRNFGGEQVAVVYASEGMNLALPAEFEVDAVSA